MYREKRIRNLRNYMESKGIEISLIFEPDNQYYISGFKAITYSRPIVTVVKMDKIELIIPGLEELHAKEVAKVDDIHVYYEIPELKKYGNSHFDHLNKILDAYPSGTKVGVERDIVTANFTRYIESKGFVPEDIGTKVFTMRFVKDEKEIEYLRIAGFLSDLALKGSLDAAKIGLSEMEFDSNGDSLLLKYISEKYPDTYVGYANWTCSGIERTSQPHLDSNTRKFADGDVVIHSRQVWYKGYRAENERTFFVGKPTDKQLDAFKVTIEAQQAGIDKIRAGISAKEVDAASRKVFEKAGYDMSHVNHRIGHGLGLSEHEEPYLRFDNELILEPGMCFSMEPGLYIPGVGGYRHSDTVIVTETGAELITKHTRKAEELIFRR